MQCNEIKNLLGQYADNELSPEQRRSVEEHISDCLDCKAELASLLEINKVSNLDFLPDPGEEYWNRLTRNISDKIAGSDRKAASAKPFWKKMLWPEFPVIRYAGMAVTAVLLFFLIKTSVFREGDLSPRGLDIQSLSKTEYSLEKNDATVKITAAEAGIGGITRAENPKGKSLPLSEEKLEDEEVTEAGKQKKEIKAAEAPPVDFDVLRMADAVDEKLPPQTSLDETKTKAFKKVRPDSFYVTGGQSSPGSRMVMARGSQNNFDTKTSHGQVTVIQPTPDIPVKEDNGSESPYFVALILTRKTKDLHKKISIWENYINTGPDEFSLRRAKFKQAELYYTMACSLQTDAAINAALKFYETNRSVFQQGSRLKRIDNYQAKIIQLDKNREGKK